MTFKITNKLKVNKLHIKFNGNFKNYITFGMTLKSLITLLNRATRKVGKGHAIVLPLYIYNDIYLKIMNNNDKFNASHCI